MFSFYLQILYSWISTTSSILQSMISKESRRKFNMILIFAHWAPQKNCLHEQETLRRAVFYALLETKPTWACTCSKPSQLYLKAKQRKRVGGIVTIENACPSFVRTLQSEMFCQDNFYLLNNIFLLYQSLLPVPRSSSPAPQGRLTVFLWLGAVMASPNVTTAVMRTIVPSAPPPSSSVTKEAALMLKSAAMVNSTVPITLMSRNVKVGLHNSLAEVQLLAAILKYADR